MWSWIFVLAAGCNTTVEVEWENRFEGDDADALAANTVRFENRIFAGGCDGGELRYEAVFARGETPPRPMALPRGSYGFDALAFSGDCTFEAHGCTQVDFFGSLDLERVVVVLSEVDLCCRQPPGEACNCGPVPEICCDGVDQDCDSVTDNCGGSCENTLDEDCDGDITEDCEECAIPSEAGFCTGNFDDDCDGLVDCADPECDSDPECNCGDMGPCAECERCDTTRTPFACTPTLADGEACIGGVCVGGACCPGCRNGATCAAGTTLAECGVGGECVACCTGDACTAGVCSPGLTSRADHLTAGADFTCARIGDATRCWGKNDSTQLGIAGESGIVTLPVLDPVLVDGVVSAGRAHACGEAATNGIWCWGDNSSFQANQDTEQVPIAPMWDFHSTGYRGVTTGEAHTCAFDESSGREPKIECFGGRMLGQLGGGRIGTPVRGRQAVMLGGAAFRATEAEGSRRLLDAGGNHTCAVHTSGRLYCWGDNRAGQVSPWAGLPQPAPPSLVRTRSRSSGFEPLDFDAGATHTCAIGSTALALLCWGEGFTDFESFPAPTGDQWQRVFSGERAVCALTNASRLLCRADAAHPIVARLGVTPVDGWYEVPILGDAAGYEEAALGTRHACAIDLVGAVVCWGDDSAGQLGGATGEGLHRVCF